MSIQVIGVGLPRTGTSSLKAALQMLGFDACQHMDNLFNAPGLVDGWIEFYETGKTDFEQLFAGFRSTSDFPGCFKYQELLEVYPAAKFVLIYRDPEAWYESLFQTIYAVVPKTEAAKAELAEKGKDSERFRNIARALGFVNDYLLDWYFEGDFLDKEKTIALYEQHYANVRANVPAAQLLELPLGAGWEPLCKFLDVPVPTEEYPYKNQRQAFIAQLGKMIQGGGALKIK